MRRAGRTMPPDRGKAGKTEKNGGESVGRGRRGQSGGNTTGRTTEKSSEKRREGVLRAEHALFRGNSMPKPEKTKPPRPSQAPAEADGARLPVRRAGRTMSTAAPDRGKTEKNGGESSFPREGKRKQRQTGAEPARCVRRGKPASPHEERGGAVPTSRNNGRRQKAPHLFQGPRPHEGNTACPAR